MATKRRISREWEEPGVLEAILGLKVKYLSCFDKPPTLRRV